MKGEEMRGCEELRNKIGVTALEWAPARCPSKWWLVPIGARSSGHYRHNHKVQEPLAHGQEETGASRSTKTYKLSGSPNGAVESRTQTGTLGTLGQCGLGTAERWVCQTSGTIVSTWIQ